MAELFFDLISVKFLLNYFSQPLRFFGKWSLFSLFLAASTFIWAIIMKILGINDFSTTPLPVISTMFVVLSVTLFMMGFITEILLRIYYDRKDNAPYMIYEVVKNNLKNNLHTLILLDLDPAHDKYMEVNEALEYLLKNRMPKNRICVGCSGIGGEDPIIKSGEARKLLKERFNKFPQCLIVPAKLHFMEEEALKKWKN